MPSNGATSRPAARSRCVKNVDSIATPSPSMAAAIAIVVRSKARPRLTGIARLLALSQSFHCTVFTSLWISASAYKSCAESICSASAGLHSGVNSSMSSGVFSQPKARGSP
ncbi:hypothetical protein D3C71_1770090 [compost metagenome]